jgi:hypothetical protein
MSIRTYEIGNRRLPSVTTILSILRSPALERWRGDVGNLVADSRSSDGAARGTSVHSLCEYLAKHGTAPTSIPTHLRSRYAAFASFYETNIHRVLECECTVHHDLPAYAGRCDLIAILSDGRTAAIDLKTSKVINEKMGMQLAAYARAAPHHIQTRVVVQIHGNDVHYSTDFPPTYATHTPTIYGYDTYEFHDMELDLYGFDAAEALWTWANRSGLVDREFQNHR